MRKESFLFFFICLAVGGLISQREGRKGSERDKDGSHVCTGWEMTYSAEIKFILLVKKSVCCVQCGAFHIHMDSVTLSSYVLLSEADYTWLPPTGEVKTTETQNEHR